MSDYKIEKLQIENFKSLIPLMKDCFGMNVNIKYFEWKFKENPAGFVEGYLAIAEDGEIAAYYGVIPELYILDGISTTIFQSCDTMTHSKHRRKGLFQKLALHCYEQLRLENKMFIIGFGGGNSTPGFVKFGWKQIFLIRYYFFPQLFSNFVFGSSKNIETIVDLSEIESLLIQSNHSKKIHSMKDKTSFGWRISNPMNKYITIGVRNDTNILSAYLTYYIDGDKIILFDFYSNHSKLLKNLFTELKLILKKSNLKGIISFNQEDSYYATSLISNGFLTNPFSKGPLATKVPFIFYAIEENMNKYSNPTYWQIGSFEHDAL